MSNGVVRYEKHIYRVKRDVPNFASSATTSDTANPLNLAGAGLYAMSDSLPGTGDVSDAKNNGLHTERNELNQIASWNYYFTRKSKKSFQLGPGKTFTTYIKQKPRAFRPIDLYPLAIVNQAVRPTSNWNFQKGQPIVIFKMISEPADINDSVPVETAKTTRTQPVSLLSYQCNYLIAKLQNTPGSVFTILPSKGIQNVVAGSVVFMGSSDNVEQKQANVD